MRTYLLPAGAGALGAIFVLGLAGLVTWPAAVRFADGHEGVAAWFQAVFSVVAIVGTWAIGERQAAHARNLRLEEDRARAADAASEMKRQMEEVRGAASAFAALVVERLRSCEVILGADPGFEDAEGILRDLRYTQQLVLEFKIADLRSATQMLVFSSFAGAVGSVMSVAERQLRLADRNPIGWHPGYTDNILIAVQAALALTIERREDLERQLDEARLAETFHEDA